MSGLILARTAVFGFIRIVNSLFGDKEPIKQEGKPQYIINEVVSPIHPITKSFQVLGIDKGKLIDPRLINMAFSKQLEWANQDRVLGYKVNHTLKEYKLARDYLLDFYDYTAFKN
jgi:hypothetical protein